MRSNARRFALIAASAVTAVAATGCEELFGTKDLRGDELGRFDVQAQQLESSCGPYLGATAEWDFSVKLHQNDRTLYWDNGQEVLAGQLDGDAFAFESQVLVDLRTEDDAGLPPCAVRRLDTASGILVRGPDGDVTGFEGELAYRYVPEPDSLCDDLVVSETPTFAKLPCSLSYDLSATVNASQP